MVDVLGLIDDVEARGVLLSGYPGNERSESLQAQLRKHHRNLNRLEEQAAEYPANQVPVHLQNQIEAEKESIDNLEDELEALQGG